MTADIAHSSRFHARLSPSAAYIYTVCAGQPRAIAHLAGVSSDTPAAAEGTCAHELAELCLKSGREAAEFWGCVIDSKAKDGEFLYEKGKGPEPDGVSIFEVDDEMVTSVQTYLDYCSMLPGRHYTERRVYMPDVYHDMSGTMDAGSYDADTYTVEAGDLKYGKGKFVTIAGNPQPVLYLKGLLNELGEVRVDTLRCTIVQPRISGGRDEETGQDGPESWREWGRIRTWTFTRAEFDAEIARLTALIARTDDPDAPLVPGDHCTFCPVAATCEARLALQLRDAIDEFGDATEEPHPIAVRDLDAIALPSPESLTEERLGQVLRLANRMGEWIKAVQAHANARAHAGDMPQGFKLVAKRGIRMWRETDHLDLAMELMALYDLAPEDIYEPPAKPKLLTAPALEKRIGRKRFRSIEAALVYYHSPGLNLVPVEDARPDKLGKAEDEFEDATL